MKKFSIIAIVVVICLLGTFACGKKEPVSVASDTAAAEEKKEVSEEKKEWEEPTEEEKSEDSGIRPEFKEAMDSYEAFFNEYIEFMEKYKDSDNPTTMLMEYAEYMQKYADMMSKLDEIDEEELTKEENIYYIEVMSRINEKLAKAAY